MKMNYHLRSSFKKTRPNLARVVIISLLILFLGWLMMLGPIRNLATALARPFWRFGEIMNRGISVNANLVQSKQALLVESLALKREIQNLRESLLEFNRVVAENSELKDLLGRSEGRQFGVLAKVVAGPNQSPFDSILIDRGALNGIKVGSQVVVFGSIPIAFISEVLPNSSRATLFSFPGKVADVIIGDNGIITSAIGRGGGNFEAKLPRELEVKAGDTVVIPEVGPQVFAVVEDILVKPADSFQTIIFKNPINISELKWVTVNQTKL